jgi:hypothetical protein
MKRYILFLALLPFWSQAQTIQGSAFPAIGSVYKLTLTDTAGIQAGNSGTGITWEFASLVNSGFTQVDSFLLPAATPYGSTFPSADITDHEVSPSTNYYVYYHNDGSEFQRIGNVQPDVVIYSDPANEFPYPLSYGVSVNDTYYASYNQTTTNTLVHMRGVASENADGTGTIVLPTGTYSNVLRVTGSRIEHDTIFSSPNIYVYLEARYTNWYQADLYYPIMQIYSTDFVPSLGIPSHTKSVGYRMGVPTGIVDRTFPDEALMVSPNPSPNGIFQIGFSNRQEKATSIDIMNITGQVVRIQTDRLSEVNLSDKPAGLYFYRIQTSSGRTYQGKLIKE